MILELFESRSKSHLGSPFPRCELHQEVIVDAFRRTCPLGQPNPLRALEAIESNGWRRHMDGDGSGGVRILERARCCGNCVRRLLSHRHVQSLRQRLEVHG